DYEVTVTAKLAKQEVQSEPVHITVHPTPTPSTLGVTWIPLHPVAGKPVVFTATLDPPNPAIAKGPYYFSFGGKWTPKQFENTYTQSFPNPGTYFIHAKLNGEHGHFIQSASAELIVVEQPPNWWKYAALAAITLMSSLVVLHLVRNYFTRLVALREMARA